MCSFHNQTPWLTEPGIDLRLFGHLLITSATRMCGAGVLVNWLLFLWSCACWTRSWLECTVFGNMRVSVEESSWQQTFRKAQICKSTRIHRKTRDKCHMVTCTLVVSGPAFSPSNRMGIFYSLNKLNMFFISLWAYVPCWTPLPSVTWPQEFFLWYRSQLHMDSINLFLATKEDPLATNMLFVSFWSLKSHNDEAKKNIAILKQVVLWQMYSHVSTPLSLFYM